MSDLAGNPDCFSHAEGSMIKHPKTCKMHRNMLISRHVKVRHKTKHRKSCCNDPEFSDRFDQTANSDMNAPWVYTV